MKTQGNVLDATFYKELNQSFHELSVDDFTYSWSPIEREIELEVGFGLPEHLIDDAAVELLKANIRHLIQNSLRLDTNERFCKIVKADPGKFRLITPLRKGETSTREERRVSTVH